MKDYRDKNVGKKECFKLNLKVLTSVLSFLSIKASWAILNYLLCGYQTFCNIFISL